MNMIRRALGALLLLIAVNVHAQQGTISGLPAAGTILGPEAFETVQSGSKKTTAAAIGAYVRGTLGSASTLAADTDTTLSTNSDSRIATQKAIKSYVDGLTTGVLLFKGGIAAAANPNYPVAIKGDSYYVTTAGKVGGASGSTVDIGDMVIASANNAGGTQAAVGASWLILEHNIIGAATTAGNTFAGNQLYSPDNTYDIGASGATRPRNVYIAGAGAFGGALTAGADIGAGSGSLIYWSGRGGMQASSDGVVNLKNQAGTDFGRLQFGGTTSIFPAIKRSAATLAFRLADDSADAGISASTGTFSGLVNGADGSSSGSAFGFASAPTTGMRRASTGVMIERLGAGSFFVGATAAQVRSDGVFGFATSTTADGAATSGLSQISAGIIGVGTGAQGSIAGGMQAATGAFGGATVGSNALAVTGTALFGGIVTVPNGTVSAPGLASTINAQTGLAFGSAQVNVTANNSIIMSVNNGSNGVSLRATTPLGWSASGDGNASNIDVILNRAATGSLQHGAADADTNAAIVGQTIRSQGLLAGGTSNQAGKDLTIIVSPGKGTGAGGSFVVQTTPAGTTGTTVNSPVTALTIDSATNATFAGSIKTQYITTPTSSSNGFQLNYNLNGLTLGPSSIVGFGPTTQLSPDTGFSRVATGVIGLGTGAASSIAGTLQTSNVLLGDTTSGTYHGNILLSQADQFPSVQFRTATTGRAQFLADVSTSGDFYIDAGATIRFRAFNSTEWMRINTSNGYVGLAVTPTYKLHLKGDSSTTASASMYIDDGAGRSLLFTAPNSVTNSFVGTGSGHALLLGTNSTPSWQINTSGHLLAVTDNTYDIGATGATRPRSIYVGTNGTFGGSLLATNYQAAVNGAFYFAGRSQLQSSSDGIIGFYNNAATDFSRAQFGGTTASFPALKRSGTTLAVRLADDSADAPVSASTGTFSGAISTVGGTAAIPNLWAADSDTGIFLTASGMGWSRDSNAYMTLDTSANGFRLASTVPLTWSSATTAQNSPDANFSRISAGLIGVGTSGQGSVAGSLSMTGLTAAGTITFAGLGSDAATADSTVCTTTGTGVLTKGSGTLGICLGTSSERYKTGIASLDAGLDQIMALKPVSYFLDAAHGDPGKRLYGFTAEQGGEVLPTLLGRDAQGQPNTFDYLGVVPVLVKAVQDLSRKLDASNDAIYKLRSSL